MSEINHTLEAGDELVDTNENTKLEVLEVEEDGSVTWIAFNDGGEKLYDTKETFSEEEIVTALADGIVATPDGRSHELVNNF